MVILVSVPVLATDTLSITVEDGAVYATSRRVDVKLTYDGEGLPTQMRVFPNEQGEWSAWGDYDDSFKWTLSGAEGERTIVVETKYWMGLGWRIRSAEDSIVLDLTPPVIVATLTPDANEHGWYNGDVAVRFDATDAVSGVAYVTGQTTLGIVADHLSLTGFAIDLAGNESTLVVRNINIDTTAPTLAPIVDPGIASDIWTPGPVIINFDPVDELSGIVYVTGQLTIDGVADDFSITGYATDAAGNTGSVVVGGINVDDELATTTIAFEPGVVGPVDLKAKLDAFGRYDANSIAVGAAFGDPDLRITLTVVAYDPGTAKYITVMAFIGCEYAAVSGLYHAVLPTSRLVSGDTYELWFEEIGGGETLTVRVTLP
jgi:hypothetical protein